jgi:hypothetical protein
LHVAFKKNEADEKAKNNKYIAKNVELPKNDGGLPSYGKRKLPKI